MEQRNSQTVVQWNSKTVKQWCKGTLEQRDTMFLHKYIQLYLTIIPQAKDSQQGA